MEQPPKTQRAQKGVAEAEDNPFCDRCAFRGSLLFGGSAGTDLNDWSRAIPMPELGRAGISGLDYRAKGDAA